MPIVVKPYEALLASAFGDSFKRAFGESFDFTRRLGLINQLLGQGFKTPNLYHPDEKPPQTQAQSASTMPYGGGTFGAKLDQRFQDVIRDAVGLPSTPPSLEPKLNLSPISEAIERSRETAPVLERLLPGTSRYLIEQESAPALPRIKSFHEWYNEYLQVNWPTIKNMLALGYNPSWIVDRAIEGYNKAFAEHAALQNELLKQQQREQELRVKMEGARGVVRTLAAQYNIELNDDTVESLAMAIVAGKTKPEDLIKAFEGQLELKTVVGPDGRIHILEYDPKTGRQKQWAILPDLSLIRKIEQAKGKGGGRGGSKEQERRFTMMEVSVDKAVKLGWVDKNDAETMKIYGKYTTKVPVSVSKDGRNVRYIRPEEFEGYRGQQQSSQSIRKSEAKKLEELLKGKGGQ